MKTAIGGLAFDLHGGFRGIASLWAMPLDTNMSTAYIKDVEHQSRLWSDAPDYLRKTLGAEFILAAA